MRLVAAAALLGTGLAGCTGSHAGSPGARQPGGSSGPRAGSVVLTVAGKTVRLAIQRCVRSSPDSVNVTAGDARTKATLVANLVQPVKASTLVYTTRKPDNSFTNYALAASVVPGTITGRLDAGRANVRVSLSGKAAEQSYRPNGKLAGKATPEELSVEATCPTVQPPRPAPTPRRAAHHKRQHHS
jgi:hypothetical protein